MSMPENKRATARSPLETELGFRIEPRPGGEAGTVVWIGKTSVRPATGVELTLWCMVQRLYDGTAPTSLRAEDAIDPFGTSKESPS